MIESYISSEDSKRQNSLNTCIKSLNTMVDNHEFEETNQDYSEIVYYGSIDNVNSIQVKYPRTVGANIPIIGNLGSKAMIVGTTNGKNVAISIDKTTSSTTNTISTSELELSTETRWDYPAEQTTVKEVVAETIDGTKITTTTTTTISYTEETEEEERQDEETGDITTVTIYNYYKNTSITTQIDTDYSKSNLSIVMRF